MNLSQILAVALCLFVGCSSGGDGGEQFKLGVKYASGDGVEKDAGRAIKFFRTAAEQGHAAAQCNLGIMYADGDDPGKNHPRSQVVSQGC